jgi:hypothetical protein
MPREDRDYRSSRDDDDRWRDSRTSQFGGYAGRGDERAFRSRGREDRDDDDRDVLGRRRGGWFGEPERHAEISRRSFEVHARAFGLPEDGRGGGRSRMSEDRGGYRVRGEDGRYRMRGEDERGYRTCEDERGGYRMRGDDDRGYRMRGGEERGGYRVRDDERRPPIWYDEVERRRSVGRGRDDDEGGYRMRGRDEDEDRGYRMRGDERGSERGGEDDERDRLGRRKGGWFGDPEGHARAVRFGRSERDDDRGYRMRGRDEDEDRGYIARGYIARGDEDEDEDRDRLGRRKGGWFGDPESHSEAARRRWDRTEGRE